MPVLSDKRILSVLRHKEIILACMALSCIWPLQFISNINLPADFTSVDISWMLSLSRAWEEQRIWGEEIIFTYGPLSFLSTRVVTGSSAMWVLLFFDLYIAGSFVYIVYKILKETFTWRRAAVILAACFFYKQAMLLSLVFTLQLLAILYLNQFKHEKKWMLLLQAVVLTTLIFYIKFNLAFVSILVFILYILYLNRVQIVSIKQACVILGCLAVSIYSVSLLLPVSLGSYVTTGLELVMGYRDAVYLYPQSFLENMLAGIVLAVFFSILALILKEFKYNNTAQKILSSVFILLLFVVFKQSYVRADIEHLKDFFYCTPPFMIVCMYMSAYRPAFMQWTVIVLWLVSIGITISFKDYFYPFKKALALPAYAYSVFQQPDYSGQISKRVMPEYIRKEIGHASVDIIPWESSLPIMNSMNYTPRPVIQSYQAYTQKLDLLNAVAYNGYEAPEYILYSTGSIDQHYNFFDDTRLKEMLYNRYYITDTFSCGKEEMILFRSSNVQQQRDFRKIFAEERNINDTIQVPASRYPLMVRINMQYSWIGEFQNFLLRAPYSTMEMHAGDSTTVSFQVAAPVLEGGVFIDRYINNRNDAVKYFQEQADENNKTKNIQLQVGNTICWKNKVLCEWYELR
ncbi:MAG: hypothetical protein ACTHJT_00370 [Cytophaga sp.]|uniref:hypothetical protein n=1 Tax=Cytophaga sp. TaxID=29535 RepID=UPI003F81360A